MLWSSDRRTFVSAWYVNMELGFAGFADFTCRFHARAVTEYESILIDEAKAGQKQHTKSTEETRRGTKEDI
jgi:hypothetical protein